MAWKATVGLAVILGAAPAPSMAQTMTVRTYNGYGVADADLAAARPMVEAVFADAGIDLSWIDCGPGARTMREAFRCEQPLETDEVVLRLQAANPLPGQKYISMGFALVNLEDGVPFLATVYVDLVRAVSRGARLDFRLLFARAIAHEIGHLLLDSNRHAEHGLMRAGWSHVELRQNEATDWVFRRDEISVLRAAASMRTRR